MEPRSTLCSLDEIPAVMWGPGWYFGLEPPDLNQEPHTGISYGGEGGEDGDGGDGGVKDDDGDEDEDDDDDDDDDDDEGDGGGEGER